MKIRVLFSLFAAALLGLIAGAKPEMRPPAPNHPF